MGSSVKEKDTRNKNLWSYSNKNYREHHQRGGFGAKAFREYPAFQGKPVLRADKTLPYLPDVNFSGIPPLLLQDPP